MGYSIVCIICIVLYNLILTLGSVYLETEFLNDHMHCFFFTIQDNIIYNVQASTCKQHKTNNIE